MSVGIYLREMVDEILKIMIKGSQIMMHNSINRWAIPGPPYPFIGYLPLYYQPSAQWTYDMPRIHGL